MRLIIACSKSIITFLILLFLINANLQSQGSANLSQRQYHWFIGVSGGPSKTGMSNDFTSVISAVEMTMKNSYTLSVDAGYYFSKYFGFSTGIGLSPYFAQLYLESYSNSLDTVDSENESYERRITGRNITETQDIYFLEIPLLINFRYPFGKTIGLYVQSGINLAIPLSNNYTSSGTYTYKGYYPAYNVVLEDIPYEGFVSDAITDVTGELKLKTLNPQFVASGGLYFFTENKLQLAVGFFYKKMLSDISDYAPVESFQLSTHQGQARSFMEGSEKTTASSMGISISLRYFFN